MKALTDFPDQRAWLLEDLPGLNRLPVRLTPECRWIDDREVAMRVVLDESRHSSLGLCESVAPEVLEIEESGELHLLAAHRTEDMRGKLQQAVETCPGGASAVEG